MSPRSGWWCLSATLALFLLAPSVLAEARDFQNYRLRLGDRVRVQVADQADLTLTLSVFTTGEISYPGVGRLVFHGKTPAQLEGEVVEALKLRGILKAEVSVILEELTRGVVYIQGAIESPQAASLPEYRDLRISQLVATAGGLSSDAEPAHIKLHRLDPSQPGGKLVISIDYEGVASGTNPADDLVLRDGDSIFVPRRVVGTFAVAGEVSRPGEYGMPPSGRTTVARAILRAGGLAEYANGKKVMITRPGRAQPIIVDVNAIFKDGDSSQDVEIESGDLIVVPRRLF